MKIVKSMKQYNYSLVKLLEENMVEYAKPDSTNANDPFGKYFNADQRRNVPPEKNTPVETTIANSLDMYFNNNEKSNLAKQIPTIDALVKQGKYKDILGAPPNTEVYRIFYNLQTEVAASILRLPIVSIKQQGEQAWYVSGGGTIGPGHTSGVQGWTTELNPGLLRNLSQFNSRETTRNRVTMILVANTNKGKFFLNPKKIATVGVNAMPEEHEIISVGPIEFIEAAYLYDPIGGLSTNMVAQECIIALNTHHVKKYKYRNQLK